jgi:Fe-S oxidoreductase
MNGKMSKQGNGAAAPPAFDKHGTESDEERLRAALSSFVRDFGASAALHMESCVRCGLCAEACHFYVATKDPKYTPISKIEPFKRAYEREVGPFAPLHKLVSREVRLSDLEQWEELIYDSCTLCGRCTMVCPMGIDIPALVELARHGMFRAGLVPKRLYEIAKHADEKHTSQSATPSEFIAIIAEIEREYGVTIPVDRDRADVLVALSASQLEGHRGSLANTAKILSHMKLDWTFDSEGFEATNFGLLSGFIELQKELTLRLVHAAVACGAKTLLLPECGHAYGALRWRGPGWYGKPFPFEVLHMSEFLGRSIESGALAVNKTHGVVTYHDPCQTARRGGVYDEPRVVLKALGLELRELEAGQEYNWCCGGGGGVLANERARPLRAQAFQIKMKQVQDTGAEKVVSACHQCHLSFEQGSKRFNWNVPFENLVELVAANLRETEKGPSS